MDADFLLIQKIKKGNEQAMDQFVSKHYSKIYQYCLLRVRDHGYAEDLTQETFLKFFQAFERYKHYGKALNYLYVIAGNLCKDYFRKEDRIEISELPEEIYCKISGTVWCAALILSIIYMIYVVKKSQSFYGKIYEVQG